MDLPVDVDLFGSNVQHFLDYPDNRGESLVDLEQRDIIDRQTSILQGGGNSQCRCAGEVNGLNTSIRVT